MRVAIAPPLPVLQPAMRRSDATAFVSGISPRRAAPDVRHAPASPAFLDAVESAAASVAAPPLRRIRGPRQQLAWAGWGEVYRAHDRKLNRDVALKVLSELFCLDLHCLARFLREAQMLASLNIRSSLAFYGNRGLERNLVLVLELVEGPTLADSIGLYSLPSTGRFPCPKQIAGGARGCARARNRASRLQRRGAHRWSGLSIPRVRASSTM